METINNATGAVKNAIWGQNTQNTDTTNNTTNTDYDRNTTSTTDYDRNTSSNTDYDRDTSSGNTGYDNKNTGSSGGLRETHKSMIDDSITESRSYSGRTESDPMAEGAYDAEKANKERNQQPGLQNAQGANFTNQQGTNANSMSNSNEPNTGFGGSGAQPSVTADPSSAQQENTHTHQGADRPNESPDDASTMSGQSGQSKQSGGMGGMKLPDQKSSEEGTGQQYIRTSGLHADGGDFDATKPGAAKEADRLMEEAGVSHGKGPSTDDGEEKKKKWYGVDHSGFGGHGSHSNNDEKPTSLSEPTEIAETTEPTEHKGFGQKIKDKLHH